MILVYYNIIKAYRFFKFRRSAIACGMVPEKAVLVMVKDLRNFKFLISSCTHDSEASSADNASRYVQAERTQISTQIAYINFKAQLLKTRRSPQRCSPSFVYRNMPFKILAFQRPAEIRPTVFSSIPNSFPKLI